MEPVSLTLLTGPANAAKVGAVFERLEGALAREPVLVVPTPADVDHYRRELAAEGIVFGAEVATFRGLVRALAAACGVPGRPLGAVARERVVRAAVRSVSLRVLAPSARAPGFAAAAGALFADLQRSLVTPGRFARALRAWDGAPAHAGELAALYSAYHRLLGRLGTVDEEGFARAALDALRERPAAWGARPVFFYGYDDLTPLQVDAVETLAGRAQADVCVALPYEAGREAFAGRAALVEQLKPLAAENVALPPPRTKTAMSSATTPSLMISSTSAATSSASARSPPASSSRTAPLGAQRGAAGSKSRRSRWCSAPRAPGA